MTAIPPPQKPDLVRLIDEAHESRPERPRPHMGCSQLGHHCDRYLWLTFRHAVVEKFSGRILRLFRRGHMEEDTIASDLRAIGVDVQSTGGSQSRVDFGSHVSGSIDGIIESGVPGAEKTRHILEAKTHSKKSFDDLVKKASVRDAKPMHWAQCQVYMYGKGIERALYYAVCKDDDRIYTERVRLDKDVAKSLVDRGQRIALTDRMPEPFASASPTWYQCKFCPAYKVCHQGEPAKEVNCRTCIHSTAEQDGTWSCAKWQATIPAEMQYAGCEAHVMHPDMVTWKLDESASTDTVAAWVIDGHTVRNGDPAEGEGIYTTREIIANLESVAKPDAVQEAVRSKFDARVAG